MACQAARAATARAARPGPQRRRVGLQPVAGGRRQPPRGWRTQAAVSWWVACLPQLLRVALSRRLAGSGAAGSSRVIQPSMTSSLSQEVISA